MIWPSVAPLPSLFICVTTLKVTFSRPYLEIMRSLCLSYMLMGGSSSLYINLDHLQLWNEEQSSLDLWMTLSRPPPASLPRLLSIYLLLARPTCSLCDVSYWETERSSSSCESDPSPSGLGPSVDRLCMPCVPQSPQSLGHPMK